MLEGGGGFVATEIEEFAATGEIGDEELGVVVVVRADVVLFAQH